MVTPSLTIQPYTVNPARTSNSYVLIRREIGTLFQPRNFFFPLTSQSMRASLLESVARFPTFPPLHASALSLHPPTITVMMMKRKEEPDDSSRASGAEPPTRARGDDRAQQKAAERVLDAFKFFNVAELPDQGDQGIDESAAKGGGSKEPADPSAAAASSDSKVTRGVLEKGLKEFEGQKADLIRDMRFYNRELRPLISGGENTDTDPGQLSAIRSGAEEIYQPLETILNNALRLINSRITSVEISISQKEGLCTESRRSSEAKHKDDIAKLESELSELKAELDALNKTKQEYEAEQRENQSLNDLLELVSLNAEFFKEIDPFFKDVCPNVNFLDLEQPLNEDFILGALQQVDKIELFKRIRVLRKRLISPAPSQSPSASGASGGASGGLSATAAAHLFSLVEQPYAEIARLEDELQMAATMLESSLDLLGDPGLSAQIRGLLTAIVDMKTPNDKLLLKNTDAVFDHLLDGQDDTTKNELTSQLECLREHFNNVFALREQIQKLGARPTSGGAVLAGGMELSATDLKEFNGFMWQG